MKRILPIAIPIALILLQACNLPSAISATETAGMLTQEADGMTATAQAGTAQALATATSTSTPATTATASVTASPAASATGAATSGPCNAATFVTDVTIPDDTIMDLGQSFTKTWRLQNAGTCNWTSSYQLVFDSGDQMGGDSPKPFTTDPVLPGQTIDVSVDLTAPNTAGTYKGNWKLRDGNGGTFGLSSGGPFWVQIKAQKVVVALPDWPLKKSGDHDAEVSALQRLLVAHGESLTVDGIFGPDTMSSVQHFQNTNGLNPDGIVGQATWPKLVVQVQQGSTGQAVRAVQGLLNDKYGNSLAVDGIFGPDTATAVKAFQTSHGLTVDGIVGPLTWQSLLGS